MRQLSILAASSSMCSSSRTISSCRSPSLLLTCKVQHPRWITDRRAVNPVRPFEKAKLSGIYTAMGRPLGAKNKRTLLREANIRGAAARAQFDLAMTDDVSINADSLAVMENAMTYFYRLALKERHRNGDADPKAIRDNLREAVTIAKEVAPYRHPRLSSVKVGSDRTNASYVPDGVTSAELREELFSMIARSGVLPTAMSERLQRAEALPEHQGVVNRRANGNGN